MSSHPWLTPSTMLVATVARTAARGVLRGLPAVPASRLGRYAAAWPPLLAALPALLRTDSERVLAAVSRVDVLAALLDVAAGPVDAARLERALLTLWLQLAGHHGLASPLALPGPFRVRVADPSAPRLLAFGGARGLVATAQGALVLAEQGRLPLDAFVVTPLPSVGTAVIVDDQLAPADPEIVARLRIALAEAGAAFPCQCLERVTVAPGDAAFGEARVATGAETADLVASAQSAFIRTVATVEALVLPGGTLVDDGGRRLAPINALAGACGNAVALPWRPHREPAEGAIIDDLDDLAIAADLTPAGEQLVVAIRSMTRRTSRDRHRALLVNVDTDDFVYSFQFGRSVERRCAERAWQVDRIAIDPATAGDLPAELGQPVPPPAAAGVEVLIASEHDPALAPALRRFTTRRYEVVVANVRPNLFYDLLAAGLLATRTLLWDRHLHGGLREEGERRGLDPGDLRGLPIQAWSLDRKTGPGLQRSLADAGLTDGSGHTWPMDLEFFTSTATKNPDCVFAGGENQRDWPLFIEAVRDLPFSVHLVTGQPPSGLPAHVHHDARLPLCRFRDAMAAATLAAVPLVAGAAAGVTVIPMAMALGVAIVATRTPWTEPLVTDGEDALLVPAGDVAAFRAAILRLHEQPALSARLVANARRRVAALCSLETFTREMFATLA